MGKPRFGRGPAHAIGCYQNSANAKDIHACMAGFTEDLEMIDVSRTFNGQKEIRSWAVREVILGDAMFLHREFMEQAKGYAKMEVNWLSWVVHYSDWRSADGKITKMSQQYPN